MAVMKNCLRKNCYDSLQLPMNKILISKCLRQWNSGCKSILAEFEMISMLQSIVLSSLSVKSAQYGNAGCSTILAASSESAPRS